MKAIWIAAAAALATACYADSATITLTSDRDNTLYEDELGGLSNGAGEYMFVGRTATGGIRRGLVRFDVSAIPADATITDVSLRLHMSRSIAGFVPVGLHRLLANWGEGTSDAGKRGGGGSPATAGDATWVHTFFDSGQWAVAGGDFAASASTSTLVNDVGFWDWPVSAALVADVSFWVANPAENFGWCVVGDETQTSAKRFGAHEHVDANLRPRLTIQYELPVCEGDLNGDDSRDLGDLAILLSGFGTGSGASLEDGDIDGDEDVDLGDLAIMLSVFGMPC